MPWPDWQQVSCWHRFMINTYSYTDIYWEVSVCSTSLVELFVVTTLLTLLILYCRPFYPHCLLFSSSSCSTPSRFFSTHAPSHCLCMLLTCSSCSTCSELFVQVSAVKATLVGPLSLSLWLSGSPLREPRGGCHYIHCQWDKHNGLALSVVWAQAWGWHQLLIRSTPVSLPLPLSLHPNNPAM